MRIPFLIHWALRLVLAGSSSAPPQVFAATEQAATQQSEPRVSLPERWWESASAVRNLSLKDDTVFPQLSLDPVKAAAQLHAIKEQGFTGIQVFGPADGGKSYNGLDARDHYRIEPKYGTVADFKRVVQIAHSLRMVVITFDNLGYSALDAPSFLKACDDMREGRQSPERQWFFWSDSKDAPLLATVMYPKQPSASAETPVRLEADRPAGGTR